MPTDQPCDRMQTDRPNNDVLGGDQGGGGGTAERSMPTLNIIAPSKNDKWMVNENAFRTCR